MWEKGPLHHSFTVHHIDDLRAGKEAHRQTSRRRALVETAVAAFNKAMRLGADRVLFLHNIPEKPHHDMRKLIRKEIKRQGGDPDRGSFLTWGMHKATNEFADIKHVIAIGVQQADGAPVLDRYSHCSSPYVRHMGAGCRQRRGGDFSN
jgi:hypothetical protein